MSIDNLADRRGFTLVEVLVALTVLTIVAVAFVPLFTFVAEGTQANRARLVATKLAASVIEEIRSLPYDQVGLIGGNPSGNIRPTVTLTVGGIDYTIQARIWWVDDPSDDSGGSDPIPYDYKRVRVSVSAPSAFTGTVMETAEIHTLVSLEGEEEVFPGGNIRVQVVRGWRTSPDEEVPVENVRADLVQGPDAPQTNWTDEFGQVLFAVLDEGSYAVEVDPSDHGMMVHPLQAKQTAELTSGVTVERVFEVEIPCRLRVELLDAVTHAPIQAAGSITLVTPETGSITRSFSADMQGILTEEFFGDIWPVGAGYPGTPYNLKVSAEGYMPYSLFPDHQSVWNGLYDRPGQSKTVVLELTPANAYVKVTSQGAGTPVGGAQVEIFRHTYTFLNGAWTDLCSAEPVASSATDPSGVAGFSLEENNPADPPQILHEGDQYTRYCVRVSAPGYMTFGPQHGSFWISGGQQMTASGPVQAYEVVLQPDFRSILVRAERPDGLPRNVWIRVTGPNGYEEIQRTGGDGEALFENLAVGLYTVYRRSGGSWVDPKVVNVVSGQYQVTYTY
ncbi:MAG: type IV pilus modification PilV family protein [Bacillota bacterium]